jgi:WD40 repeat protein
VQQLRGCRTDEEAKPVVELPEAGTVVELRFSADETRLAAHDRKVVQLWDLTTGANVFSFEPRQAHPLDPIADIRSIAITQDAGRLFVISAKNLIEFDTATGQPVHSRTIEYMLSLSMSPTGKTLAVALSTLAISLIELSPTREVTFRRIDTPNSVVTESARVVMAWSSDGRLLAAADTDGHLSVWEL